MTKKDFSLSLIIGGGVGLFVQPILSNTDAVAKIHDVLPVPVGVVRPLVFLFFLVLAPVGLFTASIVARKIAPIYQVAKFAATGSLNAFLDMGLFNILGLFFGTPKGGSLIYASFKTISFFVATTNSYFWNKLWTFGDATKSEAKKVAKFYIVTGINWALNVGVATGVSAIPQSFVPDDVWINFVSLVAGIFAGMVGNFLGYKFLVFKKEEPVVPPVTPTQIS